MGTGEAGKERRGKGERAGDFSHVNLVSPFSANGFSKAPEGSCIDHPAAGRAGAVLSPPCDRLSVTRPASMPSQPLSRACPEINLNNLISTFKSISSSTLCKGHNTSETRKINKVCASYSRRSHCLSAFKKKRTLFGSVGCLGAAWR